MQNIAVRKLLRSGPDGRLSEVLLGTLLTIAIAILAYTLTAQSSQADRLRKCETQTALHSQSIWANKETLEARDALLAEHFDALLKRLDDRCDSIERLINSIAPVVRMATKEEDS